MKYCLHCEKVKISSEHMDCPVCSGELYDDGQIQRVFNKLLGFQVRHDLYDLREALGEIKEDPLATTAKETLWIDEIINSVNDLEIKFTSE